MTICLDGCRVVAVVLLLLLLGVSAGV